MLLVISKNILRQSSWNIRFTDDLNNDIRDIAKFVVDYYLKNVQKDDARNGQS